MEEGDLRVMGAGARLLVDQLHTGVLQIIQALLDITHGVGDVMHPFAIVPRDQVPRDVDEFIIADPRRERSGTGGQGVRRCRERLEQLDAIAERIGDVDAVVTLERFIDDDRRAGLFQMRLQRGEIVDQKRRMRLLRRAKVMLNAQMHALMERWLPDFGTQ